MGYTCGFSALAFLAAPARAARAGALHCFLRCLGAHVPYFACGLAGLRMGGWAKTRAELWDLGVAPYIPGTFLKCGLCALLVLCWDVVAWAYVKIMF